MASVRVCTPIRCRIDVDLVHARGIIAGSSGILSYIVGLEVARPAKATESTLEGPVGSMADMLQAWEVSGVDTVRCGSPGHLSPVGRDMVWVQVVLTSEGMAR